MTSTWIVLGGYAAGSATLFLLAMVIARCLARAKAAARHAIWIGACVAILALPLAFASIQGREVPVQDAVAPIVLEAADLATAPEKQEIAVPSVIGIWAVGTGAVLLFHAYGLIALAALGRRSRPTKLSDYSFERASALLGDRRWTLKVADTDYPPVAMTWGLVKPVILLPKSSSEWSEERFEAVILHESAHIKRRDFLWNLIAVAACAAQWFNPLAWIALRVVRAEAELAADDAVVAAGIPPIRYAAELLRIASELRTRRLRYASLGVPIMKRSKIESRIRAILARDRNRRGISTLEGLAIAVLGLTTVIGIAALRPVPQAPTNPTIGLQVDQEKQAEIDRKIEAEQAAQVAQQGADVEAQRRSAVNQKREAGLAMAEARKDLSMQKSKLLAERAMLLKKQAEMERLQGRQKQLKAGKLRANELFYVSQVRRVRAEQEKAEVVFARAQKREASADSVFAAKSAKQRDEIRRVMASRDSRPRDVAERTELNVIEKASADEKVIAERAVGTVRESDERVLSEKLAAQAGRANNDREKMVLEKELAEDISKSQNSVDKRILEKMLDEQKARRLTKSSDLALFTKLSQLDAQRGNSRYTKLQAELRQRKALEAKQRAEILALKAKLRAKGR